MCKISLRWQNDWFMQMRLMGFTMGVLIYFWAVSIIFSKVVTLILVSDAEKDGHY